MNNQHERWLLFLCLILPFSLVANRELPRNVSVKTRCNTFITDTSGTKQADRKYNTTKLFKPLNINNSATFEGERSTKSLRGSEIHAGSFTAKWQNTLIIFDGNSLTDGTASSTGQHVGATNMGGYDYPAQCSRLFTSGNYTFYNYGVAGQTTSDMASDAATQIDASYNSSNAYNICVAWEITNAMALQGSTPDQAITDFKNYCLARKAAGFKVVVLTVLPRHAALNRYTDADFETARQQVNSSIRSNYLTYADGIADIGDNPGIPLVDQVHTNDSGYAIIAGAVHNAITTIGAHTQTLPTKFSFFTAERNGSMAILKWETSNEDNSDYFNVQYSSNGANWSTIGKMNSGKNSYSFMQVLPLDNKNYYRLQQVDKEGYFSYSKILVINTSTAAMTLNIYPNPVVSSFVVDLGASVTTPHAYSIISSNGTMFKEGVLLHRQETIEISNLAEGTYFLKITNEKTIKITKR